ncbi:MAG: glycosyltransferase family 4 protein [Clostridia bacterium]|nr:glycosyltransferase family 4 protein [Clostridia bacterium]
MKKLFIMTHNMAGGGCERVIARLANRWNAEGTEVTVITEYRHESVFPLDPGVRLCALSDKTSMGMKDVPAVYRALRALVKKERPDAVLALPEKVNVWTVLFLLGTGVPTIVSERNDPRRHPENKIKRILRRFVYPFAAGFVFQTADQRDYFPQSIRRRGTVLPNPLDTAALPSSFEGARERTVVTAARLEPQKNLGLLLRAFALFRKSHPEYRLTVFGEGREREALTRLMGELGLADAVSMPGAVGDVPERIRTASVFVLSSDFEGMPNALIEAMAMGLPCVSTDCPAGGPRELIENGVNGLLTPVGDAEALSRAMCRIADDADLAEKLGKNALGVREKHDVAVVAKKWREYIDGCAK